MSAAVNNLSLAARVTPDASTTQPSPHYHNVLLTPPEPIPSCILCSLPVYYCQCVAASLFRDSLFAGCPMYDARHNWCDLLTQSFPAETSAITQYVVACVFSGFSCLPADSDPTRDYHIAQQALAGRSQANYSSVSDHFTKAEEQVGDWLLKGWAAAAGPGRAVSVPSLNLLSCDSEFALLPLSVTPLGVVPKHGSYDEIRMIFDCRRSGLNSAIPDFPFHYKEVNRACQSLKPGCWMAKVDIKSAFSQLHLRPTDWRHLGFMWNNTYYHMKRMPFGAKSAPYIFSLVGDAVSRVFLASAPAGLLDLVNYLDDFLIIAESEAACAAALAAFMALLASLGLGVRTDKTVLPTQRCEFLGVVLDSVSYELTVSEDRLDGIRLELQPLIRKRATSVSVLESLCGKLGWLARANPLCRPYLRRLLNVVHQRTFQVRRNGRRRKFPGGHQFVRLNQMTLEDLRWWLHAVHSWHPRHLYPEDAPGRCVAIFSDASDDGWGATAHGELLYDSGFAGEIFSHIYPKEMFAVLRAAENWGHKWRGQRVLAFVDNKAVVDSINKHSTRCTETLPLLRKLNLLEVEFGFRLRATHIRGIENTLADALSRKDKWHLIDSIRKPPQWVQRPVRLWNKF
mmetsp:Transcript_20534/g.53064  ORF Transcript_20534/g.53064 Transcript_20534/m.53064 type:complete len:625 (+) Transcript_20534:1728-3602(+)